MKGKGKGKGDAKEEWNGRGMKKNEEGKDIRREMQQTCFGNESCLL